LVGVAAFTAMLENLDRSARLAHRVGTKSTGVGSDQTSWHHVAPIVLARTPTVADLIPQMAIVNPVGVDEAPAVVVAKAPT
jgi:hypothetical protein